MDWDLDQAEQLSDSVRELKRSTTRLTQVRAKGKGVDILACTVYDSSPISVIFFNIQQMYVYKINELFRSKGQLYFKTVLKESFPGWSAIGRVPLPDCRSDVSSPEDWS